MKLIARSQVLVGCSPDQAFSLVSNMERFGEWFPAVLSVVPANDLAHGQAGKKYLETVAVPLRGRRRVELTVKEAVAGRRFVTEGRFAPLLPRMEITLAATGPQHTSIDLAMFSRNRSKLVQLLLLPLARLTLQPRADQGLARLKHQLEEESRSLP